MASAVSASMYDLINDTEVGKIYGANLRFQCDHMSEYASCNLLIYNVLYEFNISLFYTDHDLQLHVYRSKIYLSMVKRYTVIPLILR